MLRGWCFDVSWRNCWNRCLERIPCASIHWQLYHAHFTLTRTQTHTPLHSCRLVSELLSCSNPAPVSSRISCYVYFSLLRLCFTNRTLCLLDVGIVDSRSFYIECLYCAFQISELMSAYLGGEISYLPPDIEASIWNGAVRYRELVLCVCIVWVCEVFKHLFVAAIVFGVSWCICKPYYFLAVVVRSCIR